MENKIFDARHMIFTFLKRKFFIRLDFNLLVFLFVKIVEIIYSGRISGNELRDNLIQAFEIEKKFRKFQNFLNEFLNE